MYPFIDTVSPNSRFSCMACVFLKAQVFYQAWEFEGLQICCSLDCTVFFGWCDGICRSHSFSLGVTAANAPIITGTTLPFGFHFCSSFFSSSWYFSILLSAGIITSMITVVLCSLITTTLSGWVASQQLVGWLATGCERLYGSGA